jgi:hypothetical protein
VFSQQKLKKHKPPYYLSNFKMTDKVTLTQLDRIPLLEGPSGYMKWRQTIEDWLRLYGFGKLLSKQTTQPTRRENESDNEYLTRVENWEEKQERAFSAIRSRCGLNAREELKDVNRADVALDKLKRRFQPKGSAIFQQLNQNYTDLTLEQCKSVSEFAEKLRTARNEIHLLDKTCKISEPHFVNKFLTGLGDGYNMFLTSFYQNNLLIPERDTEDTITKEAVTFDDAVIAAEKEEQRQRFEEQSKEGAALVAQQRQQLHCTHCGRNNHTRNTCWELHPELKMQAIAERASRRRKREELKAKRNEREDMESAPVAPVSNLAFQDHWIPEIERGLNFAFPAISLSTASSEVSQLLEHNWVLDSGCTNHASCQKSMFLPGSLRMYNGPPVNGFGGAKQQPTMIGTVAIACESNGRHEILTLSDTLYHPSAGCNLISVSQLRKRGAQLAFSTKGITIGRANKVLTADERCGLYLLRLWRGNKVALPAYSISED